MNPLNPWVALTEMLFLLAAAFFIGHLVAYGQYRSPIRSRKLLIAQLQRKLISPNQTESKPDQVEEIIPEED
ncbi:hypothetical protein [Spirosoma fluviale]|uniref:Uncharacterized protein n=1 Tax=Spirosoma fluviale TaxID=1597977 RepID=A0A286G4Q0_9BACT|nr:hypothetical protein [Spirosoma fluviale]SOD90109.1 hypothetical protein SAMN06269250_3301 [Spirosoma fluviale]